VRSGFLILILAACMPAHAEPPEVRFLCLAPSPYTHRHDALRAGMGIYLSLERVAREQRIELRPVFYDASAAFENEPKARALVRGARVLVVGSSTWAQGSSYYLRRFFELANHEYLAGVSATAWCTAGGTATGGETVIADTFRTLIGMGARVFSLGQKYMVFTTDERLAPPEGQFTLLDCWFMEQFAKTIALAATDGGAALAARLGVTHEYWRMLPRSEAQLTERHAALRDLLNAAADPRSDAYRQLRSRLAPLP